MVVSPRRDHILSAPWSPGTYIAVGCSEILMLGRDTASKENVMVIIDIGCLMNIPSMDNISMGACSDATRIDHYNLMTSVNSLNPVNQIRPINLIDSVECIG